MSAAPAEASSLLEERLRPRADLPPLLASLAERRPERLHWLGAAFGLTQELHGFWRKAGYAPVYVRQTPSDLTGENSCISLKALPCEDLQGGPAWLEPFCRDFRTRIAALLVREAAL